MTQKTKIDKSFVLQRAKEVQPADFERVEAHAQKIEDKSTKGQLQNFLKDVRTLIQMVKDYRARRYTQVPYWVMSTVVFALLYILMPIDLVPDFILGLGLVDDATVVSLCVMMLRKQLEAYRSWRLEYVGNDDDGI